MKSFKEILGSSYFTVRTARDEAVHVTVDKRGSACLHVKDDIFYIWPLGPVKKYDLNKVFLALKEDLNV